MDTSWRDDSKKALQRAFSPYKLKLVDESRSSITGSRTYTWRIDLIFYAIWVTRTENPEGWVVTRPFLENIDLGSNLENAGIFLTFADAVGEHILPRGR